MNENVLILVFMEVILLQYVIIPIDDYKEYCFNPCFYGSYSFTQKKALEILSKKSKF